MNLLAVVRMYKVPRSVFPHVPGFLEVSRVALSISAVVLLAIIVFLLIKKSGLKGGHAVVCILLGFYLASSTMAGTINDLTTSVASMIGSIKF